MTEIIHAATMLILALTIAYQGSILLSLRHAIHELLDALPETYEMRVRRVAHGVAAPKWEEHETASVDRDEVSAEEMKGGQDDS